VTPPAEHLEGSALTPRRLRSVCVFCGSAPGQAPLFVEAARAAGTLLARRGLSLVYGGGHIGMMGAVADAALAAGARVTGVIPQHLMRPEVAHLGLTELIVVGSMHERKRLMADRSDAFLVLPGGYGTLDETFEMLTWLQLGLQHKPVASQHRGRIRASVAVEAADGRSHRGRGADPPGTEPGPSGPLIAARNPAPPGAGIFDPSADPDRAVPSAERQERL
jgi:uncharacterized protein (TIGR00730 family)